MVFRPLDRAVSDPIQAVLVLKLLTSRLAFRRAGDRRVGRVQADTAALTGQLRVADRRRPVARTRNDRRRSNTRRVLELQVRDHRRVLRRIREERLFGRHEVTKIRLHRGDVRLRLGVRELRNRDRGKNTDDHDDDQELDEREAFAELKHVPSRGR